MERRMGVLIPGGQGGVPVAGSLNRISIIGNLGRDPETRASASGTTVATFSVAVNERRRDAEGNPQEKTLWFRVTAFGRLAEICAQYLSKGARVYVEGRLDPQEWTDAAGANRVTLGIIAADVRMLDGRDAMAEADTPAAHAETREPVAAGDLPF
jgi:single-strand DNA-binding protein